uniref:Uncharacterized protein n=1 Tax=Myoviridae sp. ctWiL39 TaxID=2825120 RepID=A0A8S5PY60_9CAUD|nr:MAG TPA: hypothetical protein [Myoviridae sp. ctWiL39]
MRCGTCVAYRCVDGKAYCAKSRERTKAGITDVAFACELYKAVRPDKLDRRKKARPGENPDDHPERRQK